MTERASPFDPTSASRPDPGHRPLGAGTPELDDLVERASRVPNGLALLRSAPLESAAVLLGVAPPAIERARLALGGPGALDLAAARVARGGGPRRAAAPVRSPAPRDPVQLLAAARRRADGMGLLLSAAPEAAAIAFGVHPDLVLDARAVAAQRAGRQRN